METMENINKQVAGWIKSANGNGIKGTELALAAILHMQKTGDSTVFAKMGRVENKAYQRNLGLIAKAFGYKITEKGLVPAGKDVPKVSAGMTLDSKALDVLTKGAADKLKLGGTLLAKEFGWTKPEPAAEQEPEPAAEVLMIEGPAQAAPSVLDLVLSYMADMTVEELCKVQDRYIELMQQRMDAAA